MFYNNFESACHMRGLKPTPVAIKCGGTKNSANSWRNGSSPNGEMIARIAEFLDVSTDYLLTGKTHTLTVRQQTLVANYDSLCEKNKIRVEERIQVLLEIEKEEKLKTPVQSSKIEYIKIKHSLNKVSAGSGFELFGEGDLWDEIAVPDTYEAQYCDYALTVDGDSMLPLYADEDIVLIKSQDAIMIGQIGIFIVDGELAYIKKLGTDRLISLNDDYDDIYFSETVQPICKGLVLGKV